jgi:hypothetical protein
LILTDHKFAYDGPPFWAWCVEHARRVAGRCVSTTGQGDAGVDAGVDAPTLVGVRATRAAAHDVTSLQRRTKGIRRT